MSIRRDPIYISNEVYRWLRLIAKATPETDREFLNSGRSTVSPDSIADDILRQAIREQYPQLSEHEKAIGKMEQALIQTLRVKP